MRWLLKLYPRWWRCRYEAEMLALLEETRSMPREVVDLLLGALDARLNPPRWRSWRRRRTAAGRGVLVLVGALAIVAFDTYALGWIAPLVDRFGGLGAERVVEMALFVAIALGPGRLLGRRSVTWWLLLVALQEVELGLSHAVSTVLPTPPMPWGTAVAIAQAVVWTAIPVVLLRRAGVRWLPVLLAGGGLSLLLGALIDLPLWAPLPLPLPTGSGYGRALAISLWAALLAWLVIRARRARGWGGDPDGGAGVPARPAPEAPPALTMRVG
jgi:hypothetical protein